MVEHVLPFGIRLEVETCLKLNVLACVAAQVYLLDGIVGAEEQVAEVLIGYEFTSTHVLHHDRRLVFGYLAFPKVVSVFECGLVIQRVATIT